VYFRPTISVTPAMFDRVVPHTDPTATRREIAGRPERRGDPGRIG
jgi:hypothetical protein